MALNVLCTGYGCSKKLAVVDGAFVELMCPRCKKLVKVPILDLVAELQSYLVALTEQAAKPSVNGNGNVGAGFML